jgi:crotonobetainyl-CoA:carnitine CoA-transferase CaiB-like acyl-CoA transferase
MAVAGIIPLMNEKGEYQFPTNYMADFVSSSLGITGTLAAIHQR